MRMTTLATRPESGGAEIEPFTHFPRPGRGRSRAYALIVHKLQSVN